MVNYPSSSYQVGTMRKGLMDWSQFLTGTLPPLLGVIVGGLATYFTQTKTLNKQFKREIEREKQERDIERLKVYSEILKLDGENLMLEYVGGGSADFNLKAFIAELRPIFYSKFYLLDQVVADKVRNMDSIIAAANFYEELDIEQNDRLIIIYNEIISDIEVNLISYRKK